MTSRIRSVPCSPPSAYRSPTPNSCWRSPSYQLLHRTATAILEAQRFAAHHALMLVHSFSAEDAWLDDYQAFAQRMGASDADADAIVVVGELGGVPLYLSRIRGEERYARA